MWKFRNSFQSDLKYKCCSLEWVEYREDAESSRLVHWTLDVAAWLRTLAGVIVFFGKTLYSESASLYPGVT